MMQNCHSDHRRNQHWNRTKNPHEKSDGKIESPQANRPESTSSDHCFLNLEHRNVTIGRGYEEICKNKEPCSLNKASKSHHEAAKKSYVFDGSSRRARVSIDDPALGDDGGIAPKPCSNKRA
ncbi:unnamed protein product [Coffea canephora]|uniref:Uncharacterized protein n=1 Tax=Coffea canephora TaxID=49390 RepID=A0A068UBM5_COFCA|nr:unnamed protein product [Coffea canephora]